MPHTTTKTLAARSRSCPGRPCLPRIPAAAARSPYPGCTPRRPSPAAPDQQLLLDLAVGALKLRGLTLQPRDAGLDRLRLLLRGLAAGLGLGVGVRVSVKGEETQCQASEA